MLPLLRKPGVCQKSSRMFSNSITTRAQLWIGGEHQRYAVGREYLSWQGFPWKKCTFLDKYSEHDLIDFAGNGYSATVIGSIIIAILASIPWPTQEDQDVDDAMQFMIMSRESS